ncbi:MAG: hypothetical protein LBF88_03275 [Planctomycetaceae bacterium]|jgi:hypothetical protein|nr:hypothetical protein [Planctomycetaceae bacterium]
MKRLTLIVVFALLAVSFAASFVRAAEIAEKSGVWTLSNDVLDAVVRF